MINLYWNWEPFWNCIWN